jgi:cholesterol transport system auxiliary component
MIDRMLRSAALLLVAATLALSACSLSRPAPVKETYLLEPAMPQAVAKSQPFSVRVAAVNVAAPYRGRNFVYRTGALKYETDFYVEFLVAPAAMFSEQTTRALEAAHVFTRIVPPSSGADADATLEGFVSSLYGETRDTGTLMSADIAITYYLTMSSAGASTPSWSKEYRRHVELPTRTPAGYVTALNQAFGDILGELTRDLAALPVPKT